MMVSIRAFGAFREILGTERDIALMDYAGISQTMSP
jgi:hypothetical protein